MKEIEKKTLAQKTGRRTIQLAVILVTAALLVVINSVLTVLVQTYPVLSFDLTRGKLFELSSQVRENIRTLQKPVTINVLAKEETFAGVSQYNAQANELIHQFDRNSGAIKTVYVDYVKDPTFAAAFPGLVMKHGDILVTSEGKNSLVKTEELFNYITGTSGDLSIASSRAEEAIYTAILNVTSERPVRVSVIRGHGEYGMEDFEELLSKNNGILSAQSLATGDIPSDTDMLFIAAPKSDFSDEELQKIDAFLLNNENYGKILLYCADAEQGSLPRLEEFFREWGVSVEDGAVFETNDKRVYNYHPFYAIADYAEDVYAEKFLELGKPVLMPVCRPLRLIWEHRNNYSAGTLLEFAASTGVRPSNASADFTADDAVWRGPIPALVLCSYAVRNRETARIDKASYLLVSGSAGMLDGYAVNNPGFSNAEYLVHLINQLAGRSANISFRPKNFSGKDLMLNRSQINTLGAILILIIPLIILCSGVIIWIRRSRS